jgi:hypothetical protein
MPGKFTVPISLWNICRAKSAKESSSPWAVRPSLLRLLKSLAVQGTGNSFLRWQVRTQSSRHSNFLYRGKETSPKLPHCWSLLASAPARILITHRVSWEVKALSLYTFTYKNETETMDKNLYKGKKKMWIPIILTEKETAAVTLNSQASSSVLNSSSQFTSLHYQLSFTASLCYSVKRSNFFLSATDSSRAKENQERIIQKETN